MHIQMQGNNNNNIKSNNYIEEKKEYKNFFIGNNNSNSGGNYVSFYKNENENQKEKENENMSNRKNPYGAYEKIRIQNNDINESINNNNNNNNIDKSGKKEIRYLQETKSSRNLKRIFSNYDKLKNNQIPQKSLFEINEEQKKKKNATEKCLSLYENGKIKNEVNRLLAEKNKKIKQEMELKECTFFPKTNLNDRFIADKNVNNQIMKKLESNFFDRITSWQQKREKK